MLCIKCKKGIPPVSAYCPHCGKKQERKITTRRPKSRGNGLGCVYKKDDKWVAEKTFGYELLPNGKKRRIMKRQTGIATRKEAEALLQTWSASGKEGVKTVQQLWEFWSANKMLKLSKSKQTAYKIAYEKISSVIKFTNIANLQTKDLQSTVDGLTYYPARDVKTVFSHLYQLAMADRLININLSKYIELPEHMPEETDKINQSEVDALWHAWQSGDIFAGYILLLTYTGMMPGELFKLKKDMIDYQHQAIIGCGLKTKKRKSRPIVFPDFTVPILRTLCNHSKSKIEKVLCMNKDRFYAEFKKLKERCGLRDTLKPYSARRATGSDLALQDVPAALITDIMRQNDYQVTVDHYNKFDTAELVAAVNKMYTPDFLHRN